MLKQLPLRFLIPTLIMAFCVLVSGLGYLVVRGETTSRVVERSLHFVNMELNKLQGLIEFALHNDSRNLMRQIHAGKLSEPDLKHLALVHPSGEIIASTNQQDIGNQWRNSILDQYADTIQQALSQHRSQTRLVEQSNLIEGVIDVCSSDFSIGLRGKSCGFIFYQLDLSIRLKAAISGLFHQTMYIIGAIALGMLMLILTLDLLVNRRLAIIHQVLKQWRKGHRSMRIHADGGDEIAAIGQNIDRLLQKFAEDEQALIYSQRLNEAIIHSANFSMITTDKDGLITSMNTTAQKMLGYRERDLVGNHSPALFHDANEVTIRAQELTEELQQTVNPGFDAFVAKAKMGYVDEHKWTYIRKDGSRFPVRLSVSAIRDNQGGITGFLGVAQDITEQLKAEERLENMAYFDQLTQLPNRTLYHDRLEQAMFQAKRHDTAVAVLFLDLDRFKYVNDTLGHETGDKLLINVADLLCGCIRESDTACRLGGDEFTVILGNLHPATQQQDIGRICDKIIDAISQPMVISGHPIEVGVSIGVAIYPDHGSNITRLNKAADVAMYSAKDAGRGCYYFYSPGLELNLKH